MESPVLLKRCSRCHEFKPLSKFYKNAARKDGRQRYCIPCLKEYMKTPERLKKRIEYERRRYQDPERRARTRKLANIATKKRNGTYLKKRTGKCEMLDCPNPSKSVHHLIPRWLTHDDSLENLMEMCNEHHVKAEVMLTSFFKNLFLDP